MQALKSPLNNSKSSQFCHRRVKLSIFLFGFSKPDSMEYK